MKQLTNEISIQFFTVPLYGTTKPVFNPALFTPRAKRTKATYCKLRNKNLLKQNIFSILKNQGTMKKDN
jgi:hypothetical protein